MGRLICLLQGVAIFIEQALAIVQQCNDHTDKCSARIAKLTSDFDTVTVKPVLSGHSKIDQKN